MPNNLVEFTSGLLEALVSTYLSPFCGYSWFAASAKTIAMKTFDSCVLKCYTARGL
jgi:hypothetical protein